MADTARRNRRILIAITAALAIAAIVVPLLSALLAPRHREQAAPVAPTTSTTPVQSTSRSEAHTCTGPAWVAWPAAASSWAMWGSSRLRRSVCGSTTVTWAPPRARTTATSAPMVPPPTTTVRALRGELVSIVSPVSC